MSQTLLVTDQNVRVLLGDTGEMGYAITSERLRPIIRGVVRRWAMWLAVEEDWDEQVVSFTPGDQEVTIAGLEFNRLSGFRDQNTGRVLVRVTAEQMVQLISGETDVAGTLLGDPVYYNLTENNGNVLVKIWPAAARAVGIDILVSNAPPETLTDATSYDFTKHAMTGIEAQSAAEAARVMTPANRERLGITPDAVAGWQAIAAEVKAGEYTRLGRMRDASHIPAQVN